MYSLLRLIRKERDLMESFTSLGLKPAEALELLTHPYIEAAHGNRDFLDGIFDASDRPEEGNLIVWLNDIEKDST
jgi:UDP-glucose:glycoprotein glucosyltransferase